MSPKKPYINWETNGYKEIEETLNLLLAKKEVDEEAWELRKKFEELFRGMIRNEIERNGTKGLER
jgi:AMMECR1 domain-containing protein